MAEQAHGQPGWERRGARDGTLEGAARRTISVLDVVRQLRPQGVDEVAKSRPSPPKSTSAGTPPPAKMRSVQDFTHERRSWQVRLGKENAVLGQCTQQVCVGAGCSVRATRDLLDAGFETGPAARLAVKGMCENSSDLFRDRSRRGWLGCKNRPERAQAHRSERKIALND